MAHYRFAGCADFVSGDRLAGLQPRSPTLPGFRSRPRQPDTGDWHTKEIEVDSQTNSPFSDDKGDGLDSIDGIVDLDLTSPDTYRPYPRTVYNAYVYYPDGDEGPVKRVVEMNDASQTLVDEYAESRMYPDGGPTVTKFCYKNWGEGLYRAVGDPQGDFELYLPNKLAVGESWTNSSGRYEVVGLDSTIEVEGQTFQGALALYHTSPQVGVKETIWLAPGYGEVMVKEGRDGFVSYKLLSTEAADD